MLNAVGILAKEFEWVKDHRNALYILKLYDDYRFEVYSDNSGLWIGKWIQVDYDGWGLAANDVTLVSIHNHKTADEAKREILSLAREVCQKHLEVLKNFDDTAVL